MFCEDKCYRKNKAVCGDSKCWESVIVRVTFQ